ncbi:MAG: efflux RND transporter periplasmic adaptor subunit [Bryobacteraceae bacterium]
MRKKWLMASAFGALVAVGCAGFFIFRHTAARPVPVQVATAAVENELILSAQLQPKETVNIGVPVEGRIEAFHVEVGADVYEGQLLAQVRSQANEGADRAAAATTKQPKTKPTRWNLQSPQQGLKHHVPRRTRPAYVRILSGHRATSSGRSS